MPHMHLIPLLKLLLFPYSTFPVMLAEKWMISHIGTKRIKEVIEVQVNRTSIEIVFSNLFSTNELVQMNWVYFYYFSKKV